MLFKGRLSELKAALRTFLEFCAESFGDVFVCYDALSANSDTFVCLRLHSHS